MVSVNNCPICSNSKFTSVGHAKDHTVSHETFNVVQCTSCALLITSPRPADNQLGRYYLSDDYISHTEKPKTIFDKLYSASREYAVNRKLTLVNKYVAAKSPYLLDYGCGTGFFLKKMQENGFNIAGVEPSEKARASAAKITGQQIHSSLSPFEKTFDAITLWHVLEHVSNINELLEQLKNNLSTTGTLFIAVPNYKSADARKYGMNWAGYDVPRHLWHFEQNTMKFLLEKHRLKIVDTIPMKLDAFYVSMLSEKYIAGKQTPLTFLRGLLSGLTSNLKAENKNYSSLIYIAQHQ
jgi:2-polyprenyl-3-methyl-5-hydroxy-6-metoxy-1,4-benzoquinol methylase